MNLATAIGTIEDVAVALRKQERDTTALTDQRDELVKSNEYMQGELSQYEKTQELLTKDLEKERDKCDQQAYRIGELTSMLKELLRQNVDIAAKATEMLKDLEEKPVPIIPPKTIAIVKPTFASELKDAKEKDKEERFLEAHVSRTIFEISQVPAGETFILDAPRGERVTDWILKKWYRRILSKAPGNFKDAPSIELRKESNGAWTFLRQVPKPGSPNEPEDREPIPFRTKNAEPESNGKTSDPFADNGEDIPGFLRQGPDYADQRREPNDL